MLPLIFQLYMDLKIDEERAAAPGMNVASRLVRSKQSMIYQDWELRSCDSQQRTGKHACHSSCDTRFARGTISAIKLSRAFNSTGLVK